MPGAGVHHTQGDKAAHHLPRSLTPTSWGKAKSQAPEQGVRKGSQPGLQWGGGGEFPSGLPCRVLVYVCTAVHVL